MKVKEGLIPAALGTIVTTAGAIADYKAMKMKHSKKNDMLKMAAAGVVGFGLAHVVLGTIDLIEHSR
ncbi:asparagine synthase [Clostridium thermarum]|uniref:asparagine synthase n=1 Tax=Clostridium thermarum TaxID=1716543 RepID=UPI00111E0559|nr:asparagine synthase [Clostridium thermarum]